MESLTQELADKPGRGTDRRNRKQGRHGESGGIWLAENAHRRIGSEKTSALIAAKM